MLARLDALRADPPRAMRTLRKHRMLQVIWHERIEWHRDALIRFALCMEAAQPVTRERGTASERRVIERKRRDRDGIGLIDGKRVQRRVRISRYAPERDAADEYVAMFEQFAQRRCRRTIAAFAACGAVERVAIHQGRRTES